MFEATTGEGGGEQAAAVSTDTERSETLSDSSKMFVQNCGETAEKVWVFQPSHLFSTFANWLRSRYNIKNTFLYTKHN